MDCKQMDSHSQQEVEVSPAPVVVDLALARRVLKIVDRGLSEGLGNGRRGDVCVEAAVCLALGLPHGDNPPCVGSGVRSAKIHLNDIAAWGSKKARAAGLREVAVAQLGSNEIDQKKFAKRLGILVVNRVLSKLLRDVASNERIDSGEEMTDKDRAWLSHAADKAQELKSATLSSLRPSYLKYRELLDQQVDSELCLHSTSPGSYLFRIGDSSMSLVDAICSYFEDQDKPREVKEVLYLAASCILDALRDCGSPGVKLLDEINGAGTSNIARATSDGDS